MSSYSKEHHGVGKEWQAVREEEKLFGSGLCLTHFLPILMPSCVPTNKKMSSISSVV